MRDQFDDAAAAWLLNQAHWLDPEAPHTSLARLLRRVATESSAATVKQARGEIADSLATAANTLDAETAGAVDVEEQEQIEFATTILRALVDAIREA